MWATPKLIFSILSAVLTQSACQLIFTKCLSLLHLNQFKNCTCFMRPMCASDSWYLRKNKFLRKNVKILTNCVKLESRKTVLRLALLVQDTSKAHGGTPGTQEIDVWCTAWEGYTRMDRSTEVHQINERFLDPAVALRPGQCTPQSSEYHLPSCIWEGCTGWALTAARDTGPYCGCCKRLQQQGRGRWEAPAWPAAQPRASTGGMGVASSSSAPPLTAGLPMALSPLQVFLVS